MAEDGSMTEAMMLQTPPLILGSQGGAWLSTDNGSYSWQLAYSSRFM